jgi:hypothetical protein
VAITTTGITTPMATLSPVLRPWLGEDGVLCVGLKVVEDVEDVIGDEVELIDEEVESVILK